jgi:DNA-binding transcriptional regulator GbsR (MarR family)
MGELNLKFGQVPFWAICRLRELSKIEIIVFSFICAKRFRRLETADCSMSEICAFTKLDKSQVSVAIKKLKSINWLTEKSKTKWFIPETEPAKVEKSSTKKSTKDVDDSSTKVGELTTKVDDSSTGIYKEYSSDFTDNQINKNNADKSARFENQPAFSLTDKMTETEKQSPKHRSPAFKPFWKALFAFHKERLNGVIADYAAQNMAICWLFDNNFSLDECLTLYAEQVK